MRFSALLVICAVDLAFASSVQSVPLAEVAQHAVEQSKLTSPDSTPFHLKAKIIETTNPGSPYNAEIEEYWVSSNKLRRTITSPGFSQTLIVSGEKVYEQNSEEYFPWWLNDLVTALFDPLPILDSLRNLNVLMQKPSGSEHSNSCARLQMKVGTSPAANSAFLVFCFEGSHGLLESAISPGYDAEFKDYRDFKNKTVARRVILNPESGTTIEAKITELNELTSPNESLFSIEKTTPPADRIERITVSDAMARSLFAYTPDVVWPSVRSGKTAGVLSIYASVDRSGHIREAWPLNSDNAGLEDAARDQVMKWQFKPAKLHDVPIQIETVLTFAFDTKIGDQIPILSDTEARKLATKIVEPIFPSGVAKDTEVKVQLGVSLDGTVNGVGNPYNVPSALFMAAYGAVRQWHFRPYLRNGRPDLFGADIVFRVP